MQEDDITRRLIGHLFEEHGLGSPGHTERVRTEARRLADLIAEGQTVAQALEIGERGLLGNGLRSLLYPVPLRLAVIVPHGYLKSICSPIRQRGDHHSSKG